MFKALLRAQIGLLLSAFSGRNGANTKKKSPIAKFAIVLLILYVLGTFSFMFGGFFTALVPSLSALHLEWLGFAFYALIAFALMFLGSVFSAKSQVFDARDNNLVLSMPIPSSYIIASRLAAIIVLNFVYELLVLIPLIYAWFIKSSLSVPALGIVSLVLISLTFPLLATAAACLLGWVLAIVTRRIRNKSAATVLLSLLFLAAYFFFYSKLTRGIPEIIANPSGIAGKLSAAAPLYWLGTAMANGNVLHLVFSLLFVIVPFIVIYIALSVSFYNIVGSNKGVAKKHYTQKELHITSPTKALFNRELQHLLASPAYIMNSGIGVIMTFAAAIAIIVFKGKIDSFLLTYSEALLAEVPTLLPGAIAAISGCTLSSLALFTAPSISIEGMSIWILRTLPVDEKELLLAKLKLHNVLTLPAVIAFELCVSIVLRLDLLNALFAFSTPILFTLLSAEVGLMVNLKHPMLKWQSEMIAVKQSISVLITMLVLFALIAVPVVALLVIGITQITLSLALAIYIAVLASLIVVLWNMLIGKGVTLLGELN